MPNENAVNPHWLKTATADDLVVAASKASATKDADSFAAIRNELNRRAVELDMAREQLRFFEHQSRPF